MNQTKATIELQYEAQVFMDQVAHIAAHNLTESIQRDLESVVRKRVMEIIDAQINAIVSKVLENQFQPVNTYGEAVESLTTVKGILAKKAETFLSEKVDSFGKATKDHYGDKRTRAEYTLNKMFESAIDFQAQKEIKAIAEQAKQKAHLVWAI